LLLGGCSDDAGLPATGSSQSADPAEPTEGEAPDAVDESEAAPEETWADVEEPATMKVPLRSVEGVESVRVWEGSRFRVTPSAVVVAVPSPDRGGFQTLTLGSDRLLGKDTSEEEVRYWAASNGLTEGRAKILEPVVVDGLEMEHARGRNGVEVVDGYLYSDGEISYRVIFTTPLDYTEAQRDEAIAQVMATLEFE